MESASSMYGVSFRKKPRIGQAEVFKLIHDNGSRLMNIALPTGYGKTFVGCGGYAIKRKSGDVNRLLMVVTSTAQLEQFRDSGMSELADVGIDTQIINIGYFGTEAFKKHRKDEAEVFVITVQALMGRMGDTVRDMMQTGRWMIVVDEYHHYGEGKAWGEALLSLPAQFVLAMSATPERPGNDSAFGEPDYRVSYKEAVDEGAVKRLKGHSYAYRLDLLDDEGGIESITTDELRELAGGDDPEKIEALLIKRKLRWSPKYVSPLVATPIERMLLERLEAPDKRLQVLVVAMCVSHAEMVCKQIDQMYPELVVNWIGSGDDGRADAENRAIIKKFAPDKDEDGEREDPSVDVLVNVGMAGEGLDTTLVSEVVFLTPASINNTNLQSAGRAARVCGEIEGNINFDSCSDFAKPNEAGINYTGYRFMDAMDYAPPDPDEENELGDRASADEYRPLPEEPNIHIVHVELDHIDSGDPKVVRMRKVAKRLMPEFHSSNIDDPHLVQAALALYKNVRRAEASAMNAESIARQWHESVKQATSRIVGLVIRKRYGSSRIDGRVAGDIKKAIHTKKARVLGKSRRDVDAYKEHWRWLKDLEATILDKGLPPWLS